MGLTVRDGLIAKLPAKGSGVVPVHAMRIKDGRVVAGGYASRSGRFTLRVPAGSYALFGAVVSTQRPLLERVVDVVTAKSGKRTTIKPSLKKRKAVKRKRKRAGARAAFVAVDYPALWIKQFTVPPGEWQQSDFGWGLSEMLITDLSASVARCGGVVVERRHLDWVVDEIERSNSHYFDPSTRLQRGRLIASNGTITGSLTQTGSTVTLTATYHDERTDRTGTATVTGGEREIFELEQGLAKKLTDIVCAQTPRTYSGTFSGTATSTLNQYTLTWSGTAVIEMLVEHGAPPQGAPPGDYAGYRVLSGSVSVRLDGTRGTCTAHGEATIPLQTGMFSAISYVQRVDKPYYALNIAPRGDETVPYQETGVSCQTNPEYPLAGLFFAFTPTPLQSPTGNLTGTATYQTTYGKTDYSFSFAPES